MAPQTPTNSRFMRWRASPMMTEMTNTTETVMIRYASYRAVIGCSLIFLMVPHFCYDGSGPHPSPD